VVPIAMNSGDCWPRRAFLKTPGLITVSVGPPIASAGKTPEQLLREVETWIETEMRRITPQSYAHESIAGSTQTGTVMSPANSQRA